MILEKDPQQEDFLQGRMLGNPYSCNEVGLGPLMRDVKNKICQGNIQIFMIKQNHNPKVDIMHFLISSQIHQLWVF